MPKFKMMKGMKYAGILLLTLLILSSCHKASEYHVLDIKLDSSDSTLSGEEWYLYTYGATQVTVDTLKGSTPRIRKDFDRDTTDLFILYGAEGRMILPMFPDSVPEIKIRLGGKKEQLKGIRDIDVLTKWRRLQRELSKDDVSQELIHFLDSVASLRVGLLLLQDAILQYPKSSCKEEIVRAFRAASIGSSDLAQVIGLSPQFDTFGGGIEEIGVPYYVHLAKHKRKEVTTRAVMGKKGYMAIAVLNKDDPARLHQAMAVYFRELDSLMVPSFTAVVLADSLPSAWKERKGNSKLPARYFEVDSVGEATDYIRQIPLKSLPSYMIVDSLHTVWRSWEHPDSLIHFLKSMQVSIATDK